LERFIDHELLQVCNYLVPEATKDFITDPHLWAKPLDAILSEREKVLKVLSNATKELDFFSQIS
jgi:hypothetical protein